VAWTQAVWPNVDDKQAILSEMHRVLRAGGRLALYEVVSGPGGDELHYPVPWADGPAENFLVSAKELRGLAESAGFTVREWLQGQDLGARIGATAGSGRHGMATGVDGVTLALLMPDFEERMAGLARNVEERRIDMVRALLSRT
jgi:SAM-dependent methyltransferase